MVAELTVAAAAGKPDGAAAPGDGSSPSLSSSFFLSRLSLFYLCTSPLFLLSIPPFFFLFFP